MAPVDLCQARDVPLRSLTRDGPFLAAWHDVKPRLACTIFLLVCALCILSSYLGRHSHGVATIWLGNGLLFAILVRQPRRTWLIYLAIGYLADLLGACVVNGESFASSCAVSACNSLEIGLATFLLNRQLGLPFQLSRPRPLFAFLGSGVLLAPAVACSLSALCIALVEHAPWWHTYRTWFLGDALGMAIIAPLVSALQEPAFFAIFQPRELAKTLFVLAAPAAATLLDFSQSGEPFPLLVMPALIFATYRRGFPGAVIGVFLTACIAISVTISGHGLMTLAPVTSPLHNIVAVQIFIAVTLFTIFPVSALLEESHRLARSLKQSETRYMELANTDALTGQANRRAFNERLQDEWQRAAASGLPLALLSIDVDFFKSYNDIYGHIAGDDCLRRIAARAAEAIPPNTSARLYRMGGEEFAVILPEAGPPASLSLAEQIRQSIAEAHMEHKGSPLGYQTVSIGLANTVPRLDRSSLSLLALSDQALYTAKNNGRNRCVIAS